MFISRTIIDYVRSYRNLLVTMKIIVFKLKPNCAFVSRVFTIRLYTHPHTHAGTSVSSTVTIAYNTVIVLSLFRQVVLPDHGWEADRYEGDVEGNKAITGWLYGGDFTYRAPPAR